MDYLWNGVDLMGAIQQMLLGGSQNNHVANASDGWYGGSNYMLRAGTLTGVSNGSQGTFSGWVMFSPNTGGRGGGDGVEQWLMGTINERFSVKKGTGNDIQVHCSDGTNYSYFSSSGTYLAGSTWHHILASWNVNYAAGSRVWQMYIDDVSTGTLIADGGAAFNCQYNDTNFGIASGPSGNIYILAGAVSELYLNTVVAIDLSSTTNRRKFRDAAGKPVDLGTTGSLPTGSQPAIYLPNPYSSFNVNAGSGGNFAVTGVLSAATSHP